SAPAVSVPTAVVPAPLEPPAPVAEPTVSGEAVVGALLTAERGTWSGEPLSYSYAWLLCDDHGGTCAQVPDAPYSSFLLARDDIGHTLRVVVTAANAAGAASATSPPTTQVSAAEATPS